MCSTWQSLGLWSMTGLAFLIGLAVGLRGGWHAHTVHSWGTRMMTHARHLSPAVVLLGKMLAVLTVGGLLIYGWAAY